MANFLRLTASRIMRVSELKQSAYTGRLALTLSDNHLDLLVSLLSPLPCCDTLDDSNYIFLPERSAISC